MDQLKLQAQGVPLPSSPAYRTFTPTVVALLAAILTLFCVFVEYEEPEASQGQVSQYYKWLIDVEVMIFIGFGFLMTFLRRYGKSAVGLNFFCSCLVMLAAVLLIGAVQQGLGFGATTIKLELPLLIDATFCAGSAMIAFGAVLGKTTPTQLTWLMLGLVPLYALNQHLCFKTLQALDMGGSITIHAFGAYYGLAASLVLSNKRQAFGAYTSANPKNSASYISDLFSIIGTLFLWMFWPSFNGALASIAVTEGASAAADANPHHISQQYFCVANTLLSLLGSCLSTFATSSLLNNGKFDMMHIQNASLAANTLLSLLGSCLSTFATSSLLNNGKFDMMHIQNASLAGGVAMGSASSLRLSPGGALAVGIFAGMMSTMGFARLMPALESKIGLGDTCGVHNLHGLPGLLGGLVAGLAAFGQAAGVAPHGNAQLGYQIAAMACTVAIAGLGGALVSALATGRLGIDQFKSARSRRGDQTEAGDSFENDSLPVIDGMALFDDGAFWTEVAIETPQSGPSDATNTGGSRRGGSRHGGSHRTAGGSAHLGLAGKEASARGVNGALASPKRDVAAPASGLYAGGDQV
uniref:Ammonium transporter AmtB-like domain-containing protein n=1 Tax=Tetradesmus obliquus TaxID=3088 RepID=A0A383VGY6_TETOB